MSPGFHDDPASGGFLKPWKYFSRKSRWAGTWICDEEFPSPSSSPSSGGGVRESKVGGGYDRDVALRIVINWAYDEPNKNKNRAKRLGRACAVREVGAVGHVPADPIRQNLAGNSR